MQENFAAASRFPKPWTHLTDAVLYLASYTLVVLFPASNSIILKFSGAALHLAQFVRRKKSKEHRQRAERSNAGSIIQSIVLSPNRKLR